MTIPPIRVRSLSPRSARPVPTPELSSRVDRRPLRLSIPFLVAMAFVGSALPTIGTAQETATQKATDDEPGAADLDEAVEKKIDAETAEQMDQVAALVESAIAKGLSEENRTFAKKMLGGISLQQAQSLIRQLMQGRPNSNAQAMRSEAMGLLEKAVESDPALVEGHMLIAQLSALPGGNPKRALDAANAMIDQLGNDPQKQAEAYILRATLRPAEDTKEKLADLDAAVIADPSSSTALQARALFRMETGDTEGALEDLKTLLAKEPNNTTATIAAAEALKNLGRIDEGLAMLDTTITEQPNAILYLMRAELRRRADQFDGAINDLDRAIVMEPQNAGAYLLRGELRILQNNMGEARKDIDQSMTLRPTAQGLLLRSVIAATQQRYTDAINDMKLLVRSDPENSALAIRLATYYQLDNRPTMVIEVTSEIIEREPKNWQALRTRGDAYLSVSEHAKAIADYIVALESPLVDTSDELENPGEMTKLSRSGLANNLSWVLATSPQDGIRDGEQAIQYGTEAAELSEYKEPHILSTLAAAYAESGNFEKAIEWAKKAVEIGETEEHEQIEQLRSELKSYEAGKPWREEQKTPENKVPILAPSETIDT